MKIDPSIRVPATITAGNGNDQLYAGSGKTTITAGNGNNVLVGGPADDTLTAGGGKDYFVGGGGNDSISGLGGTDTLGQPATQTPISLWNLNQTSGNVVTDAEGVQSGTFFVPAGGTPIWGVGGPPASLAPYGAGTAAGFTGNPKNFMGFANNPAFQVPNGTVEFWFNPASVAGQQTILAKASNGAADVPLLIGLSGNQLIAQLGTGAFSGTIAANQTIAASTWYNVTLTFGANGMKLYLNGNLVGSSAFAGGLGQNTDVLVLGGSNATTPFGRANPAGQLITNPFSGAINGVAIYGTVLDQLQVQGLMVTGPALANPGAKGAGLPGGLANYTFAYNAGSAPNQ